MGLSTNLYLELGTSVYDQMQANRVIIMPQSSTLAKLKQAQKIRPGDCPVMYERRMLTREFRIREEMGELICNEMKLKQDIVMNVNSDTGIGFTEDFIYNNTILKNVLDGDKVENLCEPATQVCQWRARAVDGSSFNCEVWYNHGTLNGDELLEQFTQVVMRCEIAGFGVLGFVCDAGGPSTRLMKLLRDNRHLPEGGWLPLETVVAVNPYDPSRRICLGHCSTHELKSLRNALYTSWTKIGKKQFLDENDVKIGKGLVEEMFQRDRQREVEGVAPLSEIRKSTIVLNKWLVMNAAEAKRAFFWKTL